MDNWLTAGYGLWYAHDSAHFNASRMALGVTCLVTGTGFGFTKELLDRWGGRWPFLSLTEDMEFDTWCAVNGVRVGYCPGAMLYDEQCAGFAQSWRQRTRWIQGSTQLSRRYAGSLVRGLLRAGTWRERYSCFENMTVNVYGYVLCALSAVLGMAAAAMGGCGPVRAVALPITWMYVNMFFLGAVTCIQERRTIPGGFWRKAWACLTFPLFLMTFVPIGAWAFIARPQWKPIAHTAALSITDMDRPSLTAGRADVTKV